MTTLLRTLPLRQQLYALQVLEYQPQRYLKWWGQNLRRFRLEKKKNLAWTGKARFLFFSSLLLQFGLTVASATLITKFTNATPLLLLTFLTIFPQPLLLLSLLFLQPYEFLNRRRTLQQTRYLLQKHAPLKIIGITGSYGKTSVKDMLAQVLARQYKVLATPQSYNTLFGIANFLKEKLKPEHEILLVEMGAYKKGEIRELCQMVPPQIGIITGLTDQHLERFGSRENIVAAKYELVEALPPDGLAVFNLDSPPLIPLYQKTQIPKIGYAQNNPQADIFSKNNVAMKQFDNFPQTFDLIHPPQSPNSPILPLSGLQPPASSFQLNLPGQHQINNALATIAVALYLGLTLEQIRQGLARVQPPAHRLQLLPQPNGTLIIDDAYSSNPEGVKAAVRLASQLAHRPKIVVTPGLVELGSRQAEENANFGRLIAANFDYAVIVNRTNREALKTGLRRGGFVKGAAAEEGTLLGRAPKSGDSAASPKKYGGLKISPRTFFTVNSLDQATREILPHLIQPGCLVLFENDLPDIYL